MLVNSEAVPPKTSGNAAAVALCLQGVYEQSSKQEVQPLLNQYIAVGREFLSNESLENGNTWHFVR